MSPNHARPGQRRRFRRTDGQRSTPTRRWRCPEHSVAESPVAWRPTHRRIARPLGAPLVRASTDRSGDRSLPVAVVSTVTVLAYLLHAAAILPVLILVGTAACSRAADLLDRTSSRWLYCSARSCCSASSSRSGRSACIRFDRGTRLPSWSCSRRPPTAAGAADQPRRHLRRRRPRARRGRGLSRCWSTAQVPTASARRCGETASSVSRSRRCRRIGDLYLHWDESLGLVYPGCSPTRGLAPDLRAARRFVSLLHDARAPARRIRPLPRLHGADLRDLALTVTWAVQRLAEP